jgi:hypothetical protein
MGEALKFIGCLGVEQKMMILLIKNYQRVQFNFSFLFSKLISNFSRHVIIFVAGHVDVLLLDNMLDHILYLHNLHHISLLIARGNLLIVSSQGNR